MRSMIVWFLPAIAGCGFLATTTFPHTSIPSEIAVGSGERLEMIASARGVQIYRCDPKKDAAGQFEWVFQAPEANLVDDRGTKAGRHYAGPTWEALDGSKVVGTVQARKDAPDRRSIPWLRLAARSTGGPGVLSNVRTVLRVSTSGGVPSVSSCRSDEQGRINRVDYRADYYFYVPR